MIPTIVGQPPLVIDEQREGPESVKQLIDEVAEEDVFYSVHSTEIPDTAFEDTLPDQTVDDKVPPVTSLDVENPPKFDTAPESAAVPDVPNKPLPSSLRGSIGAMDMERPIVGGPGPAEEPIGEDDGMIAPYDVFKHDPETFLRDKDKSLGRGAESQHIAANDTPNVPSVNQAQPSTPGEPLVEDSKPRKTGCCRCNIQ